MLSEFKRVKHGETPGQIPRRNLIRMREKTSEFVIFTGHVINEKCIKSFRKYIHEKGKTVQRRRDKKAIDSGLND